MDVKNVLVETGLWSEKASLKITAKGTGSCVGNLGDYEICVDSIDNICDVPPSFIKMDIEGSEYEAIKGAEGTIRRYKPKLAICVYHRLEDIVQLPKILLEYNSEYTFYLRHYSFASNETVLYAL